MPVALADDEPLFGPPIHEYSRAQAIEDGVLVDVSETARQAGIRVPTAVTEAVWEQFVKVPQGVEYQDEQGRLWDVIWMFVAQAQPGNDLVLYPLHVKNDNKPGMGPLVTLKAVIGPGDDGRPVITIMLPDED